MDRASVISGCRSQSIQSTVDGESLGLEGMACAVAACKPRWTPT
jgi:hypothetical protein